MQVLGHHYKYFNEKPQANFYSFTHTKSAILQRSSPTYNSLDGEVIDLLACVCPEKFSVLSADLFIEKKKKEQ